jgi:hypothetical protein
MTALVESCARAALQTSRARTTVKKEHRDASRSHQATTRYTGQMGVVDLRMQQAAAMFGHEILWW